MFKPHKQRCINAVETLCAGLIECYCNRKIPSTKTAVPFLPFSYALMMECWKQNPDKRPSFQELVGRMEQQMLQEVEYFDFDLLDETKDYYQVKESKTAEIDGEEKI